MFESYIHVVRNKTDIMATIQILIIFILKETNMTMDHNM